MTCLAAHVADAQQVVAAELVLNTQTELVNLSVFPSRWYGVYVGRPIRPRNNILIAINVIARRSQRYRRVPTQTFRGAVGVVDLKVEAITASDGCLAGSSWVIGKTKARTHCPIRGSLTTRGYRFDTARQQPVAIRRVVMTAAWDNVAAGIELCLSR